jgi:hypothetical protein
MSDHQFRLMLIHLRIINGASRLHNRHLVGARPGIPMSLALRRTVFLDGEKPPERLRGPL